MPQNTPAIFTNEADFMEMSGSLTEGLIAGFASLAFGTNTKVSFGHAFNHVSVTLMVTDGTHTADLTLLGQHSTANSHLASNGQGGTLVTDPNARDAWGWRNGGNSGARGKWWAEVRLRCA